MGTINEKVSIIEQRKTTCANCNYWMPADEKMTRGECRIKPPVSHMMIIQTPPETGLRGMQIQSRPQIVGQSAFPATAADCWCGMHPDSNTNLFGSIANRIMGEVDDDLVNDEEESLIAAA
jgi:hypothetical protein